MFRSPTRDSAFHCERDGTERDQTTDGRHGASWHPSLAGSVGAPRATLRIAAKRGAPVRPVAVLRAQQDLADPAGGVRRADRVLDVLEREGLRDGERQRAVEHPRDELAEELLLRLGGHRA